MKTTRIWSKSEPFGTEYAELTIDGDSLFATGVALAVSPPELGHARPYRVDYELATVERFVTSRLRVRVRGDGWQRSLELTQAAGHWSSATDVHGEVDLPAPGGDVAALQGAQDCDLAFSPVTNTMPIRRGRLEGHSTLDIVTAWVSLPDLTIHRAPQRYAFVRDDGSRSVVRFESLDSDFAADITVDEHGLVLDYPFIATRVA